MHWNPGYFSSNKVKRKNIKKRSFKNRLIAWHLGDEYYHGNRENGLGGYKYDAKRWVPIVKKIIQRYQLDNKSKILDIGTKKGFFIQAVKEVLPGAKVIGIENHKFPIDRANHKIKKYIKFNEYYNLNKYPKDYFDFVFSFNSIYMQNMGNVIKTVNQIKRVSKNNKSFISFGSYNNNLEKKIFIDDWQLVATTVLHVKEWRYLLKYLNYKGDYFFTTPKVLNLY